MMSEKNHFASATAKVVPDQTVPGKSAQVRT